MTDLDLIVSYIRFIAAQGQGGSLRANRGVLRRGYYVRGDDDRLAEGFER